MDPIADPDIGYGTNGRDEVETEQTCQHLPTLQPSVAIGESVVEVEVERNGGGNCSCGGNDSDNGDNGSGDSCGNVRYPGTRYPTIIQE